MLLEQESRAKHFQQIKMSKCKLLLKYLLNPTTSSRKLDSWFFMVENSSLVVEITWGKELKLNIKKMYKQRVPCDTGKTETNDSLI